MLRLAICLAVLPFLGSLGNAQDDKSKPNTKSSFVSLFDGNSLNGWEGDDRNWRVDDSILIGLSPKKFESCLIWGPWRLIHGTELYDVVADHAQQHDLATRYPNVVRQLREHNESWWSEIEPGLPVSIGAAEQPVVELNSGDWEGIYADNTGFVREAVGDLTGGHWNVFVEQTGDYEFTLRRWPQQTRAALWEKYEPSQKYPSNKPNVKKVAFPTIIKVRFEFAGFKFTEAADPKSSAAVVVVKGIPRCKTMLKAFLSARDLVRSHGRSAGLA